MGLLKGHIMTCPCTSLSLDFFYMFLRHLSLHFLSVCLSICLLTCAGEAADRAPTPHASQAFSTPGLARVSSRGTWQGLLSLGSLWIP